MHIQQVKPIITGDFTDEHTGIRFVEDIRGNLRPLCPMFSGSGEHIHHEDITNNYYTTNNTEITGFDYSNAQIIVLQTRIAGTDWPSNTTFYRINNSFGSGYLNYTVPFGKKFHVKSVICIQHKGSNDEPSYLGIFKEMDLFMSIPVKSEINLLFDYPLVFDSGDFMELKFWPFHKTCKLGVMLKGYTI